MSNVLLTGSGPEHHYVASVLAEQIPLRAIVVELGRQRSRSEQMRRLVRRYTVPQLAGRAGLALYRAAIRDRASAARQLELVLGERSRGSPPDVPRHEVESLNQESSRSLLEQLGPGRLLVYGTGIVSDATLALSSGTPLNLHTGVSPRYRGDSCAFWPLHNAEPEWCGATVHEITSDVDGGKIFSVVRARLEPTDGIHAVFARTVVVGAEAYADVVGKLDDEAFEADAVAQNHDEGTEYRAAMRGLRAEVRTRRNLRRGLLGP